MNNRSLYEYKSNKDCFVFGEIEESDNSVNYRKVPRELYKYCSISTAIEVLKRQQIRFSIPTIFPDTREGNLYSLAKKSLLKDSNAFFEHDIDFYTCCFTTAKISEAFMQIYSAQEVYSRISKKNDSKTLNDINGYNINSAEDFIKNNSIGVCFKFSRSDFKKCLLNTLKSKSHDRFLDFKLIEGYMQYYSPTSIDNITKNFKQNNDIPEFNDSFCNLMTYKNLNFNYEKEFRFFIASKKIDEKDTVDVKINLNECIDKIYLFMHRDVFSSKILEKTKKSIFEICQSIGINKEVDQFIKIISVYDTDISEL